MEARSIVGPKFRYGVHSLVQVVIASLLSSACGSSEAQCGGMPCGGPPGLPCRCAPALGILDAGPLGKGVGSAGGSGSRDGGLASTSSSRPDAGAPALDTNSQDAAAAVRACRWPESLNDAGPGIRACAVGRAYVECSYPSGAGCGCISNDPTTCPGCGPATGATCHSQCAANEYAVSCGGPPALLPDGGIGDPYQDAPAACTVIAGTPAGNSYSCCPCQ